MAERLLLAAILVAAAWARLGDLDLVTFLSDQAGAASLALALDGRPAVVGIRNSLNVDNAPGFLWLLQILVPVSAHPLFLTAVIAGLNVVGILLLQRLVRDLSGPRVALAAAALAACGPFAVHYSRSIWAQDVLLPLTCAAALALVAALRGGHGAWLALSAALVAWLVQVHPSGVAFALAWGLSVALGTTRRLAPWLGLGALLAALLLAPFLLHEARHGWRDMSGGRPKIMEHRVGDAVAWTLGLLGTRGFPGYFLGRQGEDFERDLGPLSEAASASAAVLTAALVLGLVLHLRGLRRESLACDLLPVAWLVLPVIPLEASPFTIQPHYLLISLPAQAWMAARGLLAGRPRPWRGVLVALLCAVHLAWFAAFNRHLEVHPWRTSGEYRTSWRHQLAVARSLRSQGPEGERRLAETSWGRFMLRQGLVP